MAGFTMIFLTDEQKKLIEEVAEQVQILTEDGNDYLYLLTKTGAELLEIITLQNKALEVACRQRNYYYAGDPEKSVFGGLASDDRELTNIMEGKG